jgi:hypothetical protein
MSKRVPKSKVGRIEIGQEGGCLRLVMMDIPPENEQEFNRIYDAEHMRNMTDVPGVRCGARFKLKSSSRESDMPRYLAIYVVDSPAVLDSPEWHAATLRGGWRKKIRPLTFNRESHCWRLMERDEV